MRLCTRLFFLLSYAVSNTAIVKKRRLIVYFGVKFAVAACCSYINGTVITHYSIAICGRQRRRHQGKQVGL